MFDCQVACSFLGMGLSIGYQRLLSTLFDIEVDKEETRSDWLQRPLTEAQKIYAAVDVVYLEEIYRLLENRLQEQHKFDWVLEDCEAQAKAACVEEDFQLSYLQRFKQSWKLRPRNLSVLQALSAWREDVCRQRDMPRNFLLHNHSMMAIAMKPAFNMRDLSAVERIRGRTLSNEGKDILEVIKTAWDRPPEEYPEPPPRPLSAQWSKKVKQLKAVINETAERHGLAPEMLVRRKDLEQLIRSGMHDGNFVLPQELAGWREAVVGEALLKSLQGESD
jgi:ribonuclease D